MQIFYLLCLPSVFSDINFTLHEGFLVALKNILNYQNNKECDDIVFQFEEEEELALIFLQKVIRGRAIQNMVSCLCKNWWFPAFFTNR